MVNFVGTRFEDHKEVTILYGGKLEALTPKEDIDGWSRFPNERHYIWNFEEDRVYEDMGLYTVSRHFSLGSEDVNR
jgi:hypothetical protein